MKPLLLILSVICLIIDTQARIVPAWPFSEMEKRADLVIIGIPKPTEETGEKIQIEKTPFNSIHPPFNAIGLNTPFQVEAVLKGDKKIKEIILHHYRTDASLPDGPSLVRFDKTNRSPYLLFLSREPDGRYQAVTGQIDPAFSIRKLEN
ncbi:MAG TPA: hypothetical protein VIS74_04565 [Chthoniobacterales bacterium]